MITLLDWIEVTLKLGLPMLAVSWFIFRWIYRRGDIDRAANHKAVSSRLKELKSNFSADKSSKPHFLYRRWMSFGGGFYGLTGLWTFVVIELSDLLRFLIHPVTTLSGFTEDAVEFIINVLINQVQNFIAALVWFVYWSDDSNILLCIAMAWLGYWLGIKLARQDYAAAHLDRIEQQLNAGRQKLTELVRRK